MQMPDAVEVAFIYGLALEIGTGFIASTFPRQQVLEPEWMETR